MFEIRFPNTRESNKITQKKERSYSTTTISMLLLTHIYIILTLLALLGLHFPLINNKIESNLLTYRQKMTQSDCVRKQIRIALKITNQPGYFLSKASDQSRTVSTSRNPAYHLLFLRKRACFQYECPTHRDDKYRVHR